METIGVVASVVAALAAVITLWITIRNSKGNILKRIDKKEEQIREIDHQLFLRFGLNRGVGGCITPLDMKKRSLQEEVSELKRKL